MDFLEKLDYLMQRDALNKSTLSKACNIPYTTIDGWYKKGYEGLKLTTLRKLADFFGTSLDFWANEQFLDNISVDNEANQLSKQYSLLSDKDRELVKNMINSLSEKHLTAASFGVEISEELEIEAQAELYKEELRQEKSTQTSSVSPVQKDA